MMGGNPRGTISSRARPGRPKTAPPGRSRWAALAILGMGVALIVVDITIINVSIPRIIADLDLEALDAGWINTCYALAFATLLITFGRIGDLWGRKRLFLAGLVLFALTSLLAGNARGLGMLLAARFGQGAGAAMILPTTLSMVHAMFRGRDRGIAFGVWGSLIGGMAALGPLVGGWLTTTYSWRWAFYVNLPIAFLTLVAAVVVVSESRDPDPRGAFDLPGFLAISVGLGGLTLGLIEGARRGWFGLTRTLELGTWEWPLAVSPVPLALGVGVMGLAGFVAIERRRQGRGRPVLFDLTLFRLRSFRVGNMIATIVGLGEFGLVFVLPLYLQTVLGYSAFRTGLTLVAMAMGGFLGGAAAAASTHTIGPRQVITLGMGLEAAGVLAAISLLTPIAGGVLLLPGLFVYGMGVGLAGAQLTSVILADVPIDRSGQASGMQSTFRQVGAALGVAILGSVYVTSLRRLTEAGLDTITGLAPDSHVAIVTRMSDSAGWYIGALRGWTPDFRPVVEAAGAAITGAARGAASVAFGFILLGLLLSRRLPDVRFADSGDDRTVPARPVVSSASPLVAKPLSTKPGSGQWR